MAETHCFRTVDMATLVKLKGANLLWRVLVRCVVGKVMDQQQQPQQLHLGQCSCLTLLALGLFIRA